MYDKDNPNYEICSVHMPRHSPFLHVLYSGEDETLAIQLFVINSGDN